MPYKLWIDDQALDIDCPEFRKPGDPKDWKIATSSYEAKNIVLEFGVPEFIQFDHDLGMYCGSADTSMIFLAWLESNFPDAIDSIKNYAIHSMNPVAHKNISSFMESWKKSREI